MDVTEILVWASILTVGVGFTPTGLTVTAPVLISCLAKILTSPVVAIAPAIALPVLLLALTVVALRVPTVKSLEAVKLIFSVAVISTGEVLGTIKLGSLKTPRAGVTSNINFSSLQIPKIHIVKSSDFDRPRIPSIDRPRDYITPTAVQTNITIYISTGNVICQ